MKAHIVNISSITNEDKTLIQIFGRLENNKSFATVIPFVPYFYIRESDAEKAKNVLESTLIEKTKFTNKNKENVLKISHENKTELIKIIKAVHQKDINTYEADLTPTMRFIIDNNLYNTIDITGETEPSELVDVIFKDAKIKPTHANIPLKVLSLDIETNKKTEELFCIGLYSHNYEKTFIKSNEKVERAVNCKTEAEVLSKFREEIIKFDPDIITGWHVIDFDLNYLRKKFEEHNIPFNFGRTNENIKLKIEDNFFRNSSANIPGRQILDGLNLIKDPFIQEAPSIKNKEFESYSLENVSQEMLGEGKIIKGKDRHEEIEKLYDKDKNKLVEYNIQDCKLAYKLLIQTKILDLAIERSILTGLPLNRLTGSIIAFDSLYIREARNRGVVSPTLHYKQKEERIKGGYVMEPKPGIYHDVLVLDFKSLYPSIIKTFNIDPISMLEKKEKGAIETTNKIYFKNEEGILPYIIEKLHNERERAKKEQRELSSYAIKIIMNSFFGVLASPNCRYFSLNLANAITHSGQEIIQLTAKKIEERNLKVIYSDTDSVFISANVEKTKAKQLGLELQKYINNFYENYIKEKYNRKSYLELEFKKYYIALMLPKIRNSKTEAGSKKRYAGLVENNGKESLEIVGLEAIRGDWTEAAKDFQIELLTKVFHKENPIPFIKDYIKQIREGKINSKLIYRKSIRKDLKDYTKITPPHVKAARLLDSMESNLVEYYITENGPEPIQKLKHKIDYEQIVKGSKQKTLF
ncbi:DNA polymerase II [Candidatus Pacearchaeota archaeon]|nr:DNA polymerase II [Candidatus Pacearchaeota archaeon]